MVTHQDWSNLVKQTFDSLDRERVTGLYTVEWRTAGEVLGAEHRHHVEGEKNQVKRFLLAANAVLYGLTKRLAPTRRLTYAAAFLLAVLGLFEALTGDEWSPDASFAVFLLVIAFVLLTFLLGMELVDKLRFRDELELARDLQAELVPQTPPDFPGFELASFNRIANTVGGDVYDFVPLPDGRLAVLFGDASGHGMTAGLIMAVTHAAFLTQVEIDPSPLAVAATLNRVLCRTGACRTGGPRQYFSGVYFLLSKTGQYSAIVAGHPPILRLDGNGRIVERIGKGAYPLGIKPTTKYALQEGRIEVGETLLFHSDGLAEGRDRFGTEYGDARIEGVAARLAGASASQLSSALAADFADFLGTLPPDDDVSVTAIRRIG